MKTFPPIKRAVFLAGFLLSVMGAIAAPPLHITTQPADKSVVVGDNVSLSVGAVGAAPLFYQWSKGDVSIPGATTDTLSLTNVQLIAAGSYKVVITNATSSVESSNAVLSVYAPPTIVTSPQSKTVLPGARVTFTVAATDVLPLSYQWKLNGKNISGATSTSLVVGGIVFADAGSYTVLVSNPYGGATSDPALLAVLPPPATIASPAANFSTTNSSLPVAGSAPTAAGITQIVYQVSNTFSHFVTAPANANGTTSWSANVPLSAGTNVLRVKALNPYGESTETVRSFFLMRPTPLSLLVSGSGRVSPYTNGQPLLVGRGYAVSATPVGTNLFSHWSSNGVAFSTNALLKFVMQSNLVLQANFIPNSFIPVAGVYSGLFCDTNHLAPEGSGYVTLTVAANQMFAGKVILDGGTSSIRGKFSLQGTASLTIPRLGKGPLNVFLQLDLTNGTESVTGVIASTNFTSHLKAFRTVFSTVSSATNFVGNYLVVINGATNSATAPGGYGYGTYKVSTSGAVTFAGVLGDGTRVSSGGRLLKGGRYPLYLPLYGGKGSFSAWANFVRPSEHVDAPFPLWFKKPGATGNLYKNGFTLSGADLVMDGTNHVIPPKGTPYVNYTNAVVYIVGGNLPETLTDNINISTNNLITVPASTNHLAVALNVISGTFTGSFIHPVTKVSTLIKGAMPNDVGFGYFLGTNQSGAVIIQAP